MYKKTRLNNNLVKIETNSVNWRTGESIPYTYITETGSEGVAIPARSSEVKIDMNKVAAARAQHEQITADLSGETSIINMDKVAQVWADTLYIRSRLAGK